MSEDNENINENENEDVNLVNPVNVSNFNSNSSIVNNVNNILPNNDDIIIDENEINHDNDFDNNNGNNNNGNNTNNVPNFVRFAHDLRRNNQNAQNQNANELHDLLSLKFIYEILFSKTFFFFSSLFNLFIIVAFFSLLKENEYDINTLESDDMVIPYIFAFIIILSLSWNFYLILLLITTKLENLTQDLNHVGNSISDIYFNPLFFILIISSLNKRYIVSSFDIFALLTVSSEYALNLFFVNLHYTHFNRKIKSIMNYYLSENYYLMVRNRIGFFMLFCINIGFTTLLLKLINETDLLYKYLVIFKGFYLFFLQLEYAMRNEISYVQFDAHYSTDENFFLNASCFLSCIQIFNFTLILHKLILAFVAYIMHGYVILSFPLFLFIIKLTMKISKTYYSYINIKKFPKIEYVTDEECTICKEVLINPRKLSCSHYFHLICLSKWIEQGNHSCPICRKEISLNLNMNNNNRDRTRNVWSFSFRINNIFSFLPNISFRVVRANNGGHNEQNLQNFHH